MLVDFEGCEGLGSRQLQKRTDGLGEKYTYGKYIGVDGKSRWMIEDSTVLSASGCSRLQCQSLMKKIRAEKSASDLLTSIITLSKQFPPKYASL